MHLTSNAPADCGNDAAANPLPPYRGFRHQVQERNRQLATAVEIFFRTGDFDALEAFGSKKSPGEQVMVLAYLIANDFAGPARELAGMWQLHLVDALDGLDRGNGAELADALGWAKGARS